MKTKITYISFFCFFVLAVLYFISGYYFKIPIKFDFHSGCPIVSVQIEDDSYLLEFDLGSRMPLSLQSRVLEKIQKKQQGVSRRLDFRGNKYETAKYLIPSASLHGWSVEKVEVQEEAYSFYAGSRLRDSTGRSEEDIAFQYFGRLGLGFFGQRNFLFDSAQSWIILCKNLRDLHKDGYNIKRFVSGSFSLIPCGILLTVETDQGLVRLLVDTGATNTLIRSSFFKEPISTTNDYELPSISSSKFVINGVNFGSTDILVMDLTPCADEFMDGILGMDFLKDHPLFFDFKKQMVYIYLSP